MTNKYFGGDPTNMGTVRALPYDTFKELVDGYLRQPVMLNVTKVQLLAMPKAEAMDAKRTAYLVPAAFKADTSQRRTEHAVVCNLLCIDVDSVEDATHLLAAGLSAVLGDLAALGDHTARSTPTAPRLRIIVATEGLAVPSYPDAVRELAGQLGISQPNRESLVPVQPMFLPTCFPDDQTDPVIYCKAEGSPFIFTGKPGPSGVVPPADPDVLPLENLRPRMEGVNLEDVQPALDAIDPACPMSQWVEIGMGLKHQFGDAGFDLWDKWSARCPEKYPGANTIRRRWDSFAGQTGDRVPVTLRSVLRAAEEAGWESRGVGENVYGRLSDWIGSTSRSTEELLDHAVPRIASVSSILGPLKQSALIGTLARVLRARGIAGVSASSLGNALKSQLAETARASRDLSPPLWSSQMVFVTASNLFYRYGDNRKMRPEVVDLVYRSPDPEKRPREWLVHDAKIQVVENLRYDPTTSSSIVQYAGVPFCNTYRASYPKADPGQMQEVLDFFMPHSNSLFGAQWAQVMWDFGAYMVQNPGKKIRWAPLVQSGVGAGKGLWAGFLTRALGTTNVQRLAAEHVLEATYNSWASGYQLTVMDEVYNVGHNSHRVMNKLKPSISDDFVSVRALYEPVQTVPNVMNFIMFTNHHNSLAVHDSDRRYFVLKSPLQAASDMQLLGGDAYFKKGYNLLTSHAGGIRALLESWVISPGFSAEGRAPVTPFLRELAAATASPLAAAIQDALDDRPHALLQPDLLSLAVLRAHLPADRLAHFSDQGLASVLREKGFVSAGRHSFDGVRHALWTREFRGDPVAEAHARRQVL
ncbi:MAG: PriCT-2 domain-containing protein [Ilumatobacteraceae bacterium]